jgi:hypothetical protein
MSITNEEEVCSNIRVSNGHYRRVEYDFFFSKSLSI